jgi:hypothetical protein
MKRTLLLAAACLAASLAQAAPPIPLDQMQLRVTYRPCAAPGIGLDGNSMYNCRFFGDSVFGPQINYYCWASFPRGSSVPSAAVLEASRQTRMVSPIPGSTYLLASGGSLVPFTRYDLDGANPVDSASFPDGEKAESFDWVDENTIICNDYGSNKKRLYLVDVTTTTGPDTLTLTKNTTWCADGWTNTPVSTRIRNVRVGQTDPNFAYYGDNGVDNNPKVYAIDLRTGESTEIGHWDGMLTPYLGYPPPPGGSATGSYGLWTVVERGGYLYLHSSDDGIQVYSMSGPTTMGAMVASYSPAQLRAITGGNPTPYYGFDVAANGEGLIVGDYFGNVYELQRRAPALSGGWQHRGTIRLCEIVGQTQNTTYNPRFFDNNIYVTQINSTNYRCSGYFDGASLAYQGGGIPVHDHRMFGRLRNPAGGSYLMGSGGSNGEPAPGETFAFDLTRYETWWGNPATVNAIDNQVVETFDWVDDDTMISTCYFGSANRKKLYLTDVTADPFALTRNTTWCADGWTNTLVTTRIRNVRVGQTYTNYAYYGDAGNNNNPAFYAINLATGASTLLGDAGTLTGGNSFGLWTVIERGNYLYVQTTDNGIQVYGPMINATNKGPLFVTYTKAELHALTGVLSDAQYYGMDLSPDAGKMVLGAAFGSVYVLERKFEVSITKSGSNVILSWPSYYAGAVVESSSTLQPGSFFEVGPQPAKVAAGDRVTATVSIAPDVPTFFRLRN